MIFNFRMFDGLEPIFYPMVWFETYTELDEETKSLMKFLGVAPKIGYILGGIFISLGSLSTLFTVYKILVNRKPAQTKKKVLMDFQKGGQEGGQLPLSQHLKGREFASKGAQISS